MFSHHLSFLALLECKVIFVQVYQMYFEANWFGLDANSLFAQELGITDIGASVTLELLQ